MTPLVTTSVIMAIGIVTAVVVYRWLRPAPGTPDDPGGNRVTGKLFGVKIELVGAAGTTAAFVLLALFVFRNVGTAGDVRPGPSDVQNIDFVITPPQTGDASSSTLKARANSFTLVLSGQAETIRVDGFDFVDNKGVLSRRQMVPARLLGESFVVSTQPALSEGRISPDRITLEPTTFLSFTPAIPLGATWATSLDVKSQTFGPDKRESAMHHLMVLEPVGAAATTTLAMNGYVGYGDITSQTVWTRSVAQEQLRSLIAAWSRSELQKKDTDEISAQFQRTLVEMQSIGEELGFARINYDSEHLPQHRHEQGEITSSSRGGLKIDGTSPIVGPILRRVPGQDYVVVVVELLSTLGYDAHHAAQEHLGELFPLPTKRSLLLVSTRGDVEIDPASARTEFKKQASPELLPQIGDSLLRKNKTTLALDLQSLEPSSVARVLWSFK